MVNNNKRKKISKKQRGRRFSANRRRLTVMTRQNGLHNIIGYMKLTRMVLCALPITGVNVLGLFDVVFNLVSKVLSTKSYNTGAFGMFTLSPADLLYNSPLLAKDGANFTFPGFPVSMKWISIKLISTTQSSERSGRWAAVLVPYRELHDANHYKSILKDMTYDEIAAMPHSKSASVRQNITLTFVMRDKTLYCARPREINEDIAVVFVIWDTGARSDLTTVPDNTVFNCEIEVQGGCVPHPIFGPRHRTAYNASVFTINSITKGDTVRMHYEDGRIEHCKVSLEENFEVLEIGDTA